MEEIFIQHPCEVSETAAPDTDSNFELPSDIFRLDCSDEEKSLITSLFQKHHAVFSKDVDDIGCTRTVTLKIRLTDNAPLSTLSSHSSVAV